MTTDGIRRAAKRGLVDGWRFRLFYALAYSAACIVTWHFMYHSLDLGLVLIFVAGCVAISLLNIWLWIGKVIRWAFQ